MSIALILGSNGNLRQLATGEALQADFIERLSASGNLAIGSQLGTGTSLLLGSAAAITQVQGAGKFQSYVDFNPLTASTVTHAEGRLFYDTNEHALAVMSDQTGNLLQIGMETYLRVVNKAGVTITNGQAVYLSGAQGNRPAVKLAIATATDTVRAIGVATHDIADNQEGWVTVIGTCEGIDTSGYSDGATLYVSDTTAGALVTTAPTGSSYAWVVGRSLNTTVNGKILVAPAPEYTMYARLNGRPGGQVLYGGTAASENLTLRSTLSSTKGSIILGDSPLDANNYNIGNIKTAYFKTWQALTPSSGAVTVNYSSYQQATVTLNAATVTLTLTAPSGPTALRLLLKQDSTGGRAIAWAKGSKPYAPDGTITIATAANAITLLGLVYDGSNWYAVASQPMQQVS